MDCNYSLSWLLTTSESVENSCPSTWHEYWVPNRVCCSWKFIANCFPAFGLFQGRAKLGGKPLFVLVEGEGAW